MIPQFELTIPPSRGQLTTVEGLMRDIIADLGTDQPLRKYQNEAAYTKIQGILDAFKKILGDKEDGTEGSKVPDIQEELFSPFTISLDDPAGNSFIEFIGSMSDPKWNLRTYHRTRQQNVELGLIAAEDDAAAEDPNAIQKMKQSVDNALAQAENASGDVPDEEILVFPGTCSSCGRPLDTLMKKVIIPYFKVGKSFHTVPGLRLTNPRIYSSCQLIAMPVVTETMKLNQVQRYQSKERKSRSRSRIRRT